MCWHESRSTMARTSSAKHQKLQRQTLQYQHRRTAALVAAFGASAVILSSVSSYIKVPRYTSTLTGQAWLDELLKGHPGRFLEQFGLTQELFKKLAKVLQKKSGFGPSKHVSAREKLAIFLYASTTGLTNRKLQERFQRSAETISKCERNILLQNCTYLL